MPLAGKTLVRPDVGTPDSVPQPRLDGLAHRLRQILAPGMQLVWQHAYAVAAIGADEQWDQKKIRLLLIWVDGVAAVPAMYLHAPLSMAVLTLMGDYKLDKLGTRFSGVEQMGLKLFEVDARLKGHLAFWRTVDSQKSGRSPSFSSCSF